MLAIISVSFAIKYVMDQVNINATASNLAVDYIGDATGEVTIRNSDVWDNVNAYFVYETDSWFLRGGNYNSNLNAGNFNFNANGGYQINNGSYAMYIDNILMILLKNKGR